MGDRNRNEDHLVAEYLVLSSDELSSFHVNILERFVADFDIPSRIHQKQKKKQDLNEILDEDWEIVGGGRWSIDENKRELFLFGTSKAL